MADAYSLNCTTGALTKNAVAVANLLDVQVSLMFEQAPGIVENPAGTLTVGFTITARVHDTASDARILAQGPAGLLPSIAGIAGKVSVYKLCSRTGDTLALTNVPGTITAAALATPSIDGYQP